jgi:hypothetical protein
MVVFGTHPKSVEVLLRSETVISNEGQRRRVRNGVEKYHRIISNENVFKRHLANC